ncbi:hypothetical protein JOD26_001834 [Limosilactobacillus caviae]|uniref:Uncharacterized protein n=1 Tax=Limosilactobacillus caviae TaxID=1769424 RepID=A0ABQ2C5Q7_9LACO|nr:hypothetical protein GCM10011459_11400 [Limosilactobacillus caviae]
MALNKRSPDSVRGLVKLYEGSSGADMLKHVVGVSGSFTVTK